MINSLLYNEVARWPKRFAAQFYIARYAKGDMI